MRLDMAIMVIDKSPPRCVFWLSVRTNQHILPSSTLSFKYDHSMVTKKTTKRRP